MRVRLAVAWLLNSVLENLQANMASGSRRINIHILLTNRTLPSIRTKSVPRSSSKAIAFSYAEKMSVF